MGTTTTLETFRTFVCLPVLARLYLIQKTIPHYSALLGGSSKEDFLIPFDGSLISLFQLA